MKKLKVGIIGCGRIAGYLEDDPLRGGRCTHVGAYQSVPECEVVACSCRTEENVNRFADRFSIPHRYTDHKEMLRKHTLDLVSVCTYAPSHCEIVVDAARAKVRGIFCEKALATSIAEGEKMIRACKRHGVVLSVNHTRRWDRDFLHVKDMIANGAIGTLQSMSGTFSGNLIHTGTHLFDILVYLAGKPKQVWGITKQPKKKFAVSSGYKNNAGHDLLADLDGVATVLFRNGVVAQVLGLGKKYFSFELDIQGSCGRIRVGNGFFEYWKMQESPHYTGFRDLTHDTGYRVPSVSAPPLVLAIEDLIAAVAKKKDTRCSGREALRSLEIALAIHESHAQQGTPVGFPVKNKKLRVVSR